MSHKVIAKDCGCDDVYRQLSHIYAELLLINPTEVESARVKYARYLQSRMGEIIQENTDSTKSQIEKQVHDLYKKIHSYYIDKYAHIDSPIRLPHSLLNADFYGWAITALYVPFYHSLGDTLGYENGKGEFNDGHKANPEYANEMLYNFIALGGINDINITNWRASDDTILYLATYRVLIQNPVLIPSDFGALLREAYLQVRPQILNRHPGEKTLESLDIQENIAWNALPYSSRAIGNGSVMRAGCIGIFYVGYQALPQLVALAIECSRITHNSAIAMLGAITAALFTAWGLERVDITRWPFLLLDLLNDANNPIEIYLQESRPNEYPLYKRDKILFIERWQDYVNYRFSGSEVRTNLKLMQNIVFRYKYLSERFSKGCNTPGGCGDDCVIMAYDAVLQSEGVFEKVIIYATLHPGDSDTVGAVALSWFGAYYHTLKSGLKFAHLFQHMEFTNTLKALMKESMPLMLEIYYSQMFESMFAQMFKN